jgi:hypothetical protein
VTSAKERGRGRQFLEALKQLDYRLHVYPQFGEPLCDLKLQSAKLWLGVVPPLVAHYIVDEVGRNVLVITPIRLLPPSGL